MDFNLSREYQLLRKMMAEFTENEVKPIALERLGLAGLTKEEIVERFTKGF